MEKSDQYALSYFEKETEMVQTAYANFSFNLFQIHTKKLYEVQILEITSNNEKHELTMVI